MNMFTGVVDRCFKECANDFTTKAVTGREVRDIRIGKDGVYTQLGRVYRPLVCRDVLIDS